MIDRKTYEFRVKTALKRSKITAILGPRQCGKTTLARIISKQSPSHFLDLESPSDRARLQNAELYLNSLKGLIIIDEIQQMPELFPLLRVLSDKSEENGRFLILGSASPQLIKQSSETLAGRVEFVDLHGFNIKETGHSRIKDLWVKGGFPLAFTASSDEDSLAWREGFVRTFLERDIPQLGIRIPADTLRRFWTMTAHSHGQILNSSRLAQSMGLSHNTIRSYIDILSSTFMLRQLQPWFENLKKRQVKSPKIYLSDTGILHHLLGIRNYEDLLGNPILGTSWESFAMEQILRNFPYVSAYFWSTHSGAELDLLLIRGERRVGIEFKFSETPGTTKSMHSALEDLNLEKLYILYPGESRFPLHDRIEVCPIPDMLEELAGVFN